MRGRVRRRGRSRQSTWRQIWLERWQKWRKWVVGGGIVVGVVVALTLGVWFTLSLFQPLTAKECRNRLAEGGFASDLQDSGGTVTGIAWGAPEAGGVVVYQEMNIVGSGGKCQSVTSEAYSSSDGRKSTSRKQLGSFSYSPGAGVQVTEAKAGVPKALADRARKEFEQMTTFLSQPVQKKEE